MREVTGHLKMLGSGKITGNQAGKSFVHYSSVEIGDEVLIKVRTAQALGDYIARGIDDSEPTTLYLIGKLIIAVKLANGKVYYWKRGVLSPILLAFLGLWLGGFVAMLATKSSFLAVMGGIAVAWLGARNEIAQVFIYQPKLSAMGGVPLKS
jgi:hypothetical protein